MKNKNYSDELESLLIKAFIPAGYRITKNIELDAVPESSKYEALVFGLDEKNIFYRKGKVTPDRPGAYLAVWQRPSSPSFNSNKPIPLKSNELDYLFVRVQEHSNITSTEESLNNPKYGIFIFPVSLLIEKGIVSSVNSKGKTGFRVFPPWSQDRGVVGTKVFSESGKRTQRWQLPYFIEIDEHGLIDPCKLNKVLSHQ
ncbi:MAG: MepB family protein [Pseudomonadales bacterium]|nr:MepB family protein [Pseudomonadales bacterium]